ncbi:Kynurenine 3-monooxygenase [Halotydeus destructor]|nr:Kynurenine 3-monooxygenase [Halotydeus destructor]
MSDNADPYGEVVTIVGGGLVGSMAAIFLSRRGYQVDLFEMRPDIRKMAHVTGKSINLAISERGRSALRSLGFEDHVLNDHGIPMRARLIHDLDGTRRSIPYGQDGQAIYSVGRRHINELLLTEAERQQNVTVHFDHKCTNVDFQRNLLKFEVNGQVAEVRPKSKLLIGCDGAHSAVRRAMMKTSRMDFSQQYIDHGYIELAIEPDQDGSHKMEVNYLHIWPRGTFMMIALPNQDGSYTVTLFMPFAWFESVNTEDKLIEFFTEYFPDAIPLIGRENLVRDYFATKPGSLMSVKCSPLNMNNQALIIGDAAHAMVPFFGQGMNCGFEDCLLLDEILNSMESSKNSKNVKSLGDAFATFSDQRTADCHAICDLAMENYIEMRSKVNSTGFIMRKKLDLVLNKFFPHTWIPLYSMVTFTRTKYNDCIKLRHRQDKLIKLITSSSLVVLLSAGIGFFLSAEINWPISSFGNSIKGTIFAKI